MNIAPAAYIVCVDDGSSCLKYYITAASYTILQQHHIVLNLHQNESAGILPLQPMLMPSVKLPRVKPLHLVRIVVAKRICLFMFILHCSRRLYYSRRHHQIEILFYSSSLYTIYILDYRLYKTAEDNVVISAAYWSTVWQ